MRDDIWTRLRRRKVVQWGIAYAAVAWGLLQGLAYVTDTFHWPEQGQQLAAIALLVGLPVVLVLAWYHGERGEQRVSAMELTIIALIVLLGGGLLWQFGRPDREASVSDDAAPPAAAAAIDTRPSIAVLPFDNRSNQSDAATDTPAGAVDARLSPKGRMSAACITSTRCT